MRHIPTIVAAILAIDFTGFTLWILSGQVPPDNFFIGAITANTLRILVGLF